MSMQEEVVVSCPRCGKAAHGVRWATANVKLNPELRQQVLTGQIRTTQCPACTHRFPVDHHFLYHDMDVRFMISYQPTRDGVSRPIPSIPLDLMQQSLPDYKLRFVTTWNQLREKILIFDSFLHDLPVEIIKFVLGAEIFGTLEFGDDGIYFLEAQQNSQGELQLVFGAFRNGELLTEAAYPYEGYMKALKMRSDDLELDSLWANG